MTHESERAAADELSCGALFDFLRRALAARGLSLSGREIAILMQALGSGELLPAVESLLARQEIAQPGTPAEGVPMQSWQSCSRCCQVFVQTPGRDRTVCQGCENELDAAFSRFERQALEPLRREQSALPPDQEVDPAVCEECGEIHDAVGGGLLCNGCREEIS